MEGRWQTRWARGLGLLALLGVGRGAAAQVPAPDPSSEVTPAHVFAEVRALRADVELIRFHMGGPRVHPLPLHAKNAAPREVYFQALTLFRKANQLCFEVARERAPLPPPPGDEILPADVRLAARAARERLVRVLSSMGVQSPTPIGAPLSIGQETPTDVFHAIVSANRQLNRLIRAEFTASEVFEQVTLALDYGEQIRGMYPGRRMPEAPAFEPGKRPADVYERLLRCLAKIRDLQTIAGIQGMSLQVKAADLESATPSDVYDIASIAVAEMRDLAARRGLPHRRRGGHYPGVRFPAHVYQRVGLLERLLNDLLRQERARGPRTPQPSRGDQQ